ncbi:MAG TPA: hypothetical protein VFS21_27930 [Roseiflexaceae bacterium]|nr:hypothetical protein [Roseiflexaceae bacterium]
MRRITTLLLFCAALALLFGELPAIQAQQTTPPVSAQVTAVPVATPEGQTRTRRRDEPPPPSVIERTRPTLQLAGVVGIGTVLAILIASLLIHRRHYRPA